MKSLGVISYDDLEFAVEMARFGYVRTSDWGPGWNFLIGGFSTGTERGRKLYPYGLMIFAEAAPLPLDSASFLGQVIEYSLGYYEQADWGASWAASTNDFQDFSYNVFCNWRPYPAEIPSWRTSSFIPVNAPNARPVMSTRIDSCTTRLTS